MILFAAASCCHSTAAFIAAAYGSLDKRSCRSSSCGRAAVNDAGFATFYVAVVTVRAISVAVTTNTAAVAAAAVVVGLVEQGPDGGLEANEVPPTLAVLLGEALALKKEAGQRFYLPPGFVLRFCIL